MVPILLRILCLVIGYGFGLIQAGYLVGRIYNIDIRKEGSGHSGATNALRVLGFKAGLITFFIDALKCVGAILLIYWIFGNNDLLWVFVLYTGLGVTLGHNFPFYLNFKGGKGIAVMGGLVITIAVFSSPWIAIIPAFAFFSSALLTRYVSVGSLQVPVIFLFMMIFYGQTVGFEGLPQDNYLELYIIVLILGVLAWVRHKDNIKRLIKGEENPFGSKKEKEK
jgi:glycerol-3-phosphate acyltransferase PlsY